MSLVAAAICPHPPLLVPDLAGTAAAELNDLRVACDTAIVRLLDSAARRIVVVGGDSATREYFFPFRGSFRRFGVDITVVLGDSDRAAQQPALPVSLTMGAWLLRRNLPDRPISWTMIGLASDTPVAECVRLGERNRGNSQPWGLLVMGDGSACRGTAAPGYDDARAKPYDDRVAAALADADAEALLGLDPVLSAELKAAGRAPWQVLAGAVRAAGGRWRGDLSYHAAPYGVAYFVSNWEVSA